MSILVVVAALAAGVLGTLLRYLVTTRLAARTPWGVLIVNAGGSLVAGLVLGAVHSAVMGADVRLILLSGFAGGLTTFSTFSVETVQLALSGRWGRAIGSVAANLLLGVAFAVAGYALAGGFGAP